MPELIEVDAYRRAALAVAGRTVARVRAPDPWFLKRGLTAADLEQVLVGTRFGTADRRGKLLMLPTDRGAVLGLRFGMTGRIVVDGSTPIDGLEYGPDTAEPAWDRFGVDFRGGGSLVVNDPRRLGGVELDPDLGRLGPDAATLTTASLRDALNGSEAPLKSRLLDQSRVAGLGNLLVDETLFGAGLDPCRAAGGLDAVDTRRLARAVRDTVARLGRRGGSHTGDLQEHRHPGSSCPRCGVPLRRGTVGGRTTYWCPRHQT